MSNVTINKTVWEGYAEILPRIEWLAQQPSQDENEEDTIVNDLFSIFLNHTKKIVRGIIPNYRVLKYSDVEQFAAIHLLIGIRNYRQISKEKRLPIRAHLENYICSHVIKCVAPFNKPVFIPAGTSANARAVVKRFRAQYPEATSPLDVPNHEWTMPQSKEMITKYMLMMESQQLSTISFDEEDTRFHFGSVEPTEKSVLKRELKSVVSLALETLTDSERQCINGFYFDEKNIDELAIEMEVSPAWVSQQIQNGLIKMRELPQIADYSEVKVWRNVTPPLHKKKCSKGYHKLGVTIKTIMEHPELTDREKRVIVGRENLDGQGEKTLQQLANELGCTRENVRIIEAKAHRKLPEYLVCNEMELLARKFIRDTNNAVAKACGLDAWTDNKNGWKDQKSMAKRARSMIIAKCLPPEIPMEAILANMPNRFNPKRAKKHIEKRVENGKDARLPDITRSAISHLTKAGWKIRALTFT